MRLLSISAGRRTRRGRRGHRGGVGVDRGPDFCALDGPSVSLLTSIKIERAQTKLEAWAPALCARFGSRLTRALRSAAGRQSLLRRACPYAQPPTSLARRALRSDSDARASTTTTLRPARQRMAEAGPIVVLGGGITGVCLAYYLLQLDPSLDVTVSLRRRRIADASRSSTTQASRCARSRAPRSDACRPAQAAMRAASSRGTGSERPRRRWAR